MIFEPGKMYRSSVFNKHDIYILAVEEVEDTYQLTVKCWDRFDMLMLPKPVKLLISKGNNTWEKIA